MCVLYYQECYLLYLFVDNFRNVHIHRKVLNISVWAWQTNIIMFVLYDQVWMWLYIFIKYYLHRKVTLWTSPFTTYPLSSWGLHEYIVLGRINAHSTCFCGFPATCTLHTSFMISIFSGAVFRNVLQRTYDSKWRKWRYPREPPLKGREPTWDMASTQAAAAGSWQLDSWAPNTARIITLPPHCPGAHTTSTGPKPELTPTPKTHIISPCPTPSPKSPAKKPKSTTAGNMYQVPGMIHTCIQSAAAALCVAILLRLLLLLATAVGHRTPATSERLFFIQTAV